MWVVKSICWCGFERTARFQGHPGRHERVERQQKLRYDEQHPEFLGLVMTDKNRWEYQQVVDKQSQERALKLHAPKAEQSKGLKL